MIKLKWALLLVVSFGFTAANAQKDNCIADVKGVYDQLQERMQALNGKNFYMHIAQENQMSEQNGGALQTTEMKVWYNGRMSKFYSEEITVIQDAERVISIIPERKLIMVNRSSHEEFKQAILVGATGMQDQVFSKATTSVCNEFQRNGNDCKRIVAELNPQAQEELSIGQIDYTINQDKGELMEVMVTYAGSSSPLQSMKVSFLELSYNYKGEPMYNSAMSAVFSDGNSVLKEEYAGYQLLDATK